jgi:hypothetical protein
MSDGGEPINQLRSPMSNGGEPINQLRNSYQLEYHSSVATLVTTLDNDAVDKKITI